ncbi:MAG: fatty acyl-AMP ligase, partial [Deltaproteobacteria bacterium]|nr:fatty acyl-AMP ligase [Deltaproteobacteria bacterium]
MTRPIPEAARTHSPAGPTIPQAIRDTADVEGGVRFLLPEGGELYYTRAEISDAIDRRGQHLLARGLKKGDRLGLVLPHNHEFVLSFMGALAVGVIPVPMYPPLSLGKLDTYVTTAEHILDAAHAKALLTEKKVQGVLWSLLDRVKSLEAIHCVEDMEGPASGERPDVSRVALDDVAFLQFTSGSTSGPKGVAVTHRSLLANLHSIMKFGLRIDENDVAVSWLPMYHDMGLIGMMLAPAWYSVPTVYIPTLTFVKHPAMWMETVHRFRGTCTFAPNFAFALARRRTSEEKLAKLDLSCLKALGCGAEPNHPTTLRAFLDHFAKAGLKPTALLPCYGMAEATLAMTFNPLGEGLRTDRVDAESYQGRAKAEPPASDAPAERVLEYASCGFAMPEHGIKILGEDGRFLPDREVGEVVFQGPSMAAGYHRQPEASKEVFKADGLRTGDLGYLVKGELFVTGRKKDIIILNGRNYDPQSVEWEVAEVPGIRKGNVVAFSRPTETTEELVVVAESKEPDGEA